MEEKIKIFSKDLEITDRIRNYVTAKLDKIDRFITDYDDIRVDLAKQGTARSAADRYIAQITVRGKGFILRTEERADDLAVAFDTAMVKIGRQIERFKGKRARGRGDGTPIAEAVIPDFEIEPEEFEEDVISRRKKFTMTPMSELEAIEQMHLSGHENFFIFFNAETDKVNVLYKRHDGTYGLIETEVG